MRIISILRKKPLRFNAYISLLSCCLSCGTTVLKCNRGGQWHIKLLPRQNDLFPNIYLQEKHIVIRNTQEILHYNKQNADSSQNLPNLHNKNYKIFEVLKLDLVVCELGATHPLGIWSIKRSQAKPPEKKNLANLLQSSITICNRCGWCDEITHCVYNSRSFWA